MENFGLSDYVEYRIFVIWLVQRINVHLHTIIYTSKVFENLGVFILIFIR